MGTLNEDLTSIKAIEDKLTANKVANFAYTDHAYANPLTEADGVKYYDVNKEQNIPLPDPSIMNVNETVLTKGWRSQASAITRMLMNHFLGRVSYNLNKLNDNMSSLLATLMSHLGSANGIAPLNADGLLDINKGGTNASTIEGARTNLNINNVVNTGDSAVPVSGGTTKFTTGGAYTELNKKVDKSSVTSEVASGNNNPVTSGGVYEALKDKVNMLIQSNPGGVTTYVMIKCENYASLNMLITNRYSDMLIIQSQNGQMLAKKLSYAINYSLDSIKMFSFSEDNTTKGAVLLKFKGYNPLAIIQLDTQSVYSKSYISQNIFENPDSNFNNISYYKEYNTMSAVPFIGTPVPPSSNGNYALQCNVAGGVLSYNWKDSDVTIPSDAVLHYSFDDVPDYPDGTADVRLLNNNTYNIQSTDYNFISDNGGTLANSNGNMLITGSGANSGARIAGAYLLNKLIKISINITEVTGNLRIGSYTTTSYILDKTGRYDIVLLYDYTGVYNNLYFHTNGTFTAIIEKIYIGNGSYVTPIIDNSGDNINAINNGGIAIKGVCGKGAYFLKEQYAKIGNLDLSSNFSVSVWVKPDNTTSGLNGEIFRNIGQFVLRNGSEGTNVLSVLIWTSGTLTSNNTSALLPANTWTHVTVTRRGTSLRLYLNGVLNNSWTLDSGNLQHNGNAYYVCSSVNTRPQTVDDLLIFNRALSADEVTALYLNKANTPKFYDINNYNIDNATPVPEQNSNKLFSAGGAFDFFGGNTKANSWLGKVFYWALGRKWSEGLTNTGVGFNTVYYANGLWHGCATNSNGLWWSDNGKDWNAISVSACSDVYYANGMWVAGGAKVYWSIDGKTWTQGTGLANNSIITHVRYANGIWVAVLQAIGLVWSTDGKAWSEAEGATASAESPMDYTFGSLYYANGLWVAGGSHGLWFSGNGKTWAQGSGAPTGYTFKSICYDEPDGLWVAVSNGKGAYWSNDGIHWTAGSANQIDAQFQSVTNNADGLWVAVSQGGASYKGIWWSEDGKTWTHVTGATSNIAFWLIYYANGIWVAGGNSCGLWWSKDGKRWLKGTSESSLFDTMNFDSSYCADGIWLAGGTTLHGAYYSDYTNADIQ